ncbi:DNA-binding protein [Chryseobacterium mucoviscidosis]|uniref:helix-turn-helix domain-containing protein n=1 Tax=unclassified Paenibacillus TaxID=185978 RepID=UPI0009A37145|nr:DNA-binding protein [Chryseobacterium mucoviscidosis]
MTEKNIYKWEDMPDVMTAQDIANVLGISRKTVYELFTLKTEHGGIPNYPIGVSKRADKVDVIAWKNKLKERST